MSSTEKLSQEKSNTETPGPKPVNVIHSSFKLKRRTSLKPSRSLLKVRSLRPMRAALGKVARD